MTLNVRRWLGLCALIPGQAMVFLDQTILPVALPTIQAEFHANSISMKWTINAYILALALFVLLGGKLVDAFGARRSFMAATAVFIAASVLCALSPSAAVLIAARWMQGMGAALLLPSCATLVFLIFSKNSRGKAMGLNTSVSSIFLILGPLVGGFITQHYTWHWLFLINVPLGLIGIFLAPHLLPDSPRKALSIDFPGLCWFIMAALGWVVWLMQAPIIGWTSPVIMWLPIMGTVASLLLVRRERCAAHPYLNLRLFAYSTFRATTISLASAAAILMLGVLWAVYFQQTLGFSPSESGLLTFASALPVIFMAPIGGALSDRYGPRLPISLGFICMMAGLAIMGIYSSVSTPLLVVGLFMFGVGVPMIMTPSYSAGLGSIPPSKVGAGSGMLSTTRACMSTLSLAVITAIYSNATYNLFTGAVRQDPMIASMEPSQVARLVLGYAPALLQQLPAVEVAALTERLKAAQIGALMWLHFGTIALLALIWVWVLLVFHRSSGHRLPEHIGEGWD